MAQRTDVEELIWEKKVLGRTHPREYWVLDGSNPKKVMANKASGKMLHLSAPKKDSEVDPASSIGGMIPIADAYDSEEEALDSKPKPASGSLV